MRRTASSSTAAGQAILCAVIVLALGLAAAGASAGDPVATAAKKGKCKGPLWKCAPKGYHLSATDTIGPGSQSSGIQVSWSAEVDLVRLVRSIGTVVYGTTGGTVRASGSYATQCTDGSPATIRIEPQTISVPPGAGYPFLGNFGVEFSLIGSDKNTFGGPLGPMGSGHSELYVTAIDPCPDGPGAFQTELPVPLSGGIEGRGKVGKALSGSGTDNRLSAHHSYSWKLTPKKK